MDKPILLQSQLEASSTIAHLPSRFAILVAPTEVDVWLSVLAIVQTRDMVDQLAMMHWYAHQYA